MLLAVFRKVNIPQTVLEAIYRIYWECQRKQGILVVVNCLQAKKQRWPS